MRRQLERVMVVSFSSMARPMQQKVADNNPRLVRGKEEYQ